MRFILVILKILKILVQTITHLVLQATNTKQDELTVVVPAYVLVAVVHIPAVSVVAIALCGTPPVAVVADIDETATRTTAAARKGGKAMRVLARIAFA